MLLVSLIHKNFSGLEMDPSGQEMWSPIVFGPFRIDLLAIGKALGKGAIVRNDQSW